METALLVPILRAIHAERVGELDLVVPQLPVVDVTYAVALVDTPAQRDGVFKRTTPVRRSSAARAGLVEGKDRADLVRHREEEAPADHAGTVARIDVGVQVS
ncbi:hypothetical protein [Streptomyces antarcticus]|uniref:hypothetical protein n=1 Tax=Streptomyces antarcticus TaxID=2996458 RepID=UPI00226EEDB8|nr:hypothetical protein [Streptomyces sp. H34-AA3]MCY0942013.1 hypothetical protein [Streptomyces sp. H34-AA3]